MSGDIESIGLIVLTFLDLFKTQIEMLLGCFYVWILLGPSGLWGLSSMLLTVIPAYFATKFQYKLYEKRLEIRDKRVSMLQEAIQAISMIKMMAAERFWFNRLKTVRDEEFQRFIQARLIGAFSSFL